MEYCYLESSLGPLLLAGEDKRLCRVGFPAGKEPLTPGDGWRQDGNAFADARRQLTEYFEGKRRQFDLELEPEATAFQRMVLAALTEIPYGQTATYQQIAERIGRPGAVRAVGAANGRNPLPVIIPCHRVIGSDGSLTGYGGGLAAKRFLLSLEAGASPPDPG